MRGQDNAGLLGNRHDLGEKVGQPLPELFVGCRRHFAGGRIRVVDHVPGHAVGHGAFDEFTDAVQPDGRRVRRGWPAARRAATPAMLKL